MSANGEEKFLDWKRYDLSVDDAKILQSGGWLTADHFNFGFGLLCGHPEGSLQHPNFGFVNPLTVMMLRYGDEATTRSVVEDCKLLEKTLTFIPLCDASPTDEHQRGTHWRLLVYCRLSLSFHLYDSSRIYSSGKYVSHEDSILVTRLMQALIPSNLEGKVIQEKCPQQQNGYDCGMYVFCIVELLFNAFIGAVEESTNTLVDHETSKVNLNVGVQTGQAISSPHDLSSRILAEITPSVVSARRQRLYDSARELREQWLASKASPSGSR